jgi:hypothetical protein
MSTHKEAGNGEHQRVVEPGTPEFTSEPADGGQLRAAATADTTHQTASDGPAVASESMTAEATLSRLDNPDTTRVPPGKQLSGDPPAR